jgi:hypothetical protein
MVTIQVTITHRLSRFIAAHSSPTCLWPVISKTPPDGTVSEPYPDTNLSYSENGNTVLLFLTTRRSIQIENVRFDGFDAPSAAGRRGTSVSGGGTV